MSGTLGRCTYLPGQSFLFKPDGTSCDECADEAQHTLVTEADSMGAEYAHLCTYHFAEAVKAQREARAEHTQCGICGATSVTTLPTRDPEEGQSGPIYDACPACRHTLLSCPDEDEEDSPWLGEDDAQNIGVELDTDDEDLD